MSGTEIWNVMRWVLGLYFIALGMYAISTRRMPRLRRPHWSWPFPPGTQYRDRQAIASGIIFLAIGILFLFARR